MASDKTHFESVVNRIREKLNKEKIKLWLPPYTSENGEKGTYSEELIQQYSLDLRIPDETIVVAFDYLRVHALEKLAAQKKFSSTGVATITVHLAGSSSCDNISSIQIQTELSICGADFRRSVSKETGLDPDRLKIISCGHVIEDDRPLENQFVKNNGKVMVIVLSEDEVQTRKKQREEEQVASNVSRMRHAAEVLANRRDGGTNNKYYLEISDQNGRPLQLPDNERKALALALTLHEKGKAVLKQKKYAEALLLLLEADKEFNRCRSEILQAVDNYAIVCLDIVWCYFWLKSISDLPNAEERLKKSKECFEKSYGKNLARLEVVRGGSSCELALFVRLHLLEGVCAYLRGNYEESGMLLARADEQLRRLKPDEDKLMQLAAMGFSMRESRLALRACSGDVTLAVSHITQRREEKNQRRIKEKEERTKKKLAEKLGKTANGDWVNVDAHKTLVGMGFPENAAAEGLRQANNDISQAIQILQENPELLLLPDTSCTANRNACNVSDETVAQVMSMGFDMGVSREALLRCQGNIQHALEMLFNSGGLLPLTSEISHDSSSGTESSEEEEEDAEVEKAVEELVPDLTQDEEAYLDLTLEDESAVIDEYKALLRSTGYSV